MTEVRAPYAGRTLPVGTTAERDLRDEISQLRVQIRELDAFNNDLLGDVARLQEAAPDPEYAALVANLVAYAFHWSVSDVAQRAGCEERLRNQVKAIHAWSMAQPE